MADVKDILPDLAKLDAQLDDLEDALGPLLTTDLLTEQASQLPLLDKAKLFSLTAYAIESLLFAHLRLQGADAQKHPVYAELKRIQQSFGKIKAAEEAEGSQDTSAKDGRSLVVNQEAAARMLKADLPPFSPPRSTIYQFPLTRLHVSLIFHITTCPSPVPAPSQPQAHVLQAPNKSLSSKLAERIAEERAKALLKSVGSASTSTSKRAAAAAGGQDAAAPQSKRRKGKHKKQK
ncbi:exosome-associated family protein [Moelleriella libera RCEF 2490]|uniref:Exosome complex protein n=1 Tax=Moelleriella libera RCEF 2490 TaxID=1081109 RepID=A0A167XV72_9HYPO|nr:exosome-associated family protein [Moelleriella libera RCEF 2490]